MNYFISPRVARHHLFSFLITVIFACLCGGTSKVNAQTVDSFNPGIDTNGVVNTIAIDSGRRVLIGGTFRGVAGNSNAYLGRLNEDGRVDFSFTTTSDKEVTSIVSQPDHKLLFGGWFTNFAGQGRSNITRLNADLSNDSAFTVTANNSILVLGLQPDAKILAGGKFTLLSGVSHPFFSRMNSNGTFTSETFSSSVNGSVDFFAGQADGRFLVHGNFTAISGQSRANFGRVQSSGAIDSSFNPQINGTIACFVVQADQRIVVGGSVSNVAGQVCTNLVRLNSDGTLDTGFGPQPNGPVYALALQADRKLVVAGAFTSLAGQECLGLGRLNEDGSLDNTFNSSVTGAPGSVVIQEDGSILVGGAITSLGGEPRAGLGRLINTEPATQSLSSDDTSITWLRGGTSPEASWTTFDVSSDGLNWQSAGSGTRITGGWQVTGTNFSTNPYFRARAFIATSRGGFVAETLSGELKIVSNPVSRTNLVRTTAVFSVDAIGSGPMHYQWFKDMLPLSEGGNISGSTAVTLAITNVYGPAGGNYFVVISNAFGSVTSQIATLTVIEPLVAVQPIGVLTNIGQTATFTVQALGTPPFTYQWRRSGVPLPAETASSLTVSNIVIENGAPYDVVISNSYGSVTSLVAHLEFPPLPDSLNAVLSAGSISPSVFATAVQPDGKFLVGGAFLYSAGIFRSRLARFNADGTLDTGFNPGVNNEVFSIVVQPDGKILIGGWFSGVAGQTRTYIARVNADGSLDTSFNVSVGAGTTTPGIYSVALRPNGKILIGGDFTSVAGQTKADIAQLNPDGTIDNTFSNASANLIVYSLVLQPDGKILVGGSFTNLCGQPRQHIGRLNEDGSLDVGFNPGCDNLPLSFACQTDGKILVGGSFSTLGGQARKNIGRLNTNGTIDLSYNPGASSVVRSIAMYSDNSAFVAGSFTNVASIGRKGCARLNSNGTLDPLFDAAVDPTGSPIVYSAAIEPSGKVIIGGTFSSVGGTARYCLARLTASQVPVDELSVSGSTVSWIRGPLSPAFSSVNFETYRNGWFDLGTPQRTIEGPNERWFLSSGSISNGLPYRVRGFMSGGRYSSSSGICEKKVGPLNITQQPSNCTYIATTVASLAVQATGTDPLTYQWYKAEVAVTNSASISGANSALLIFGACTHGDVGDYFVIVSDGMHSVTSSVVTLTIVDPLILTQPTNSINAISTRAVFGVTAGGTPPLVYQWYKDNNALTNGGNIAGAQTATLSVSYVLGAEAGGYSAVVSNSWGAVTSRVANLVVLDPAIATNPTTRTVSAGKTTIFNAVASGTPTIAYQWYREGVLLPDATKTFLTLNNLQAADEGGYYLVASNNYGAVTSTVANLYLNRAVLDPEISNNGPVNAIGMQRDKKVVVGGSFTTVMGTNRTRLARYNADDTLDASFKPSANNSDVFVSAIQPDGKIVVGGQFTNLNGQAHSYLGRLGADGDLDYSFNPVLANGNPSVVYAMALQADGKILVGGNFKTVNGQNRTNIARLNANGTLDTNFIAAADNVVYAIVLQRDEKIIVAGAFTNLCGQLCKSIGRLNVNGALETAPNGADAYIDSLAVQPDGKILAGGAFSNFGSQAKAHIMRLNSDFSIDNSFNATADGEVNGIILQTDRKILVSGSFFNLNNQQKLHFGRLLPDGSLDFTVAMDAGGDMNALCLKPDGKVVAGGAFTSLDGTRRTYFGQFSLGEPAVQNLTFDGATITWMREGTSPEIVRAMFDYSTNGTSWIPLGEPARIANGWQMTGLDLPINASIRARGPVVGGRFAGSTWFDEVTVGPEVNAAPYFIDQPVGLTNLGKTNITITSYVEGNKPLSFTWYRDGIAVINDTQISGVTNRTLFITNATPWVTGDYILVVSNAFGTVTSAVARVVVNDPFFTQQPVGRTNNAGSAVTFSVVSGGTPAIAYSWRKNGAFLLAGGNISGVTSSNLSLTSITGSNSGNYTAVISNLYGAVTSSIAVLQVTDPYIVEQPQSQLTNVGGTTTLSVLANGGGLQYQWRKSGNTLEGRTAAALVLTNVQVQDIGSYDVVVRSDYGSVTSSVAVLTVNAATAEAMNPGPDNTVFSAVTQIDGRSIVAGPFGSFLSPNLSRKIIAGLNEDGTVDGRFTNANVGVDIRSVSLQEDNGILIGGAFTSVAGVSATNIARLTSSGAVDTNFCRSANGEVNAIMILPDGKLIVAGGFTSLGGKSCQYIGRLNQDGTVDTNFLAAANATIKCVALQPDGGILIGGGFATINGQQRPYIGRLFADGSLDTGFAPIVSYWVMSLVIQSDDKIVLGGGSPYTPGQLNSIKRLNKDGSLDSSFNATLLSSDGSPLTFALQADGSMLVGGTFSLLCGKTCYNLGRIDRFGAIDPQFLPNPNSTVFTAGLQADDKIIVGGGFSSISGVSRSRLARISNSVPSAQSLTFTNSSLVWLRSGGCAEVWRTSFHFSTDGTNWNTLGAGTRIVGGWQLTNVVLPGSGLIRARGFVTGGYQNGSSWFVEMTNKFIKPLPAFLSGDSSFGFSSNRFGFNSIDQASRPIVIDGSSNLIEWTPLWTNTNSSGAVYFRDEESSNAPSRFYRLRVP